MNKLILFDIDGTLITSKHFHSKTFHVAIEKVYGIKPKIDWSKLQGMTDLQIVYHVLRDQGLKKKEIKPKLKECAKFMESYYRKGIKKGEVKALPGAIPFVKALKKEGVKLALVTGNIKPVAKVKLNQIKLWNFFPIGGFGSDGFKRRKLAKIAIKRAEKKWGKFKKKDIYQIGDTPCDIMSGNTNHLNSISVATGMFSRKRLLGFKPKYSYYNLKDYKKLVKIITE